jgi:hypothetical protein
VEPSTPESKSIPPIQGVSESDFFRTVANKIAGSNNSFRVDSIINALTQYQDLKKEYLPNPIPSYIRSKTGITPSIQFLGDCYEKYASMIETAHEYQETGVLSSHEHNLVILDLTTLLHKLEDTDSIELNLIRTRLATAYKDAGHLAGGIDKEGKPVVPSLPLQFMYEFLLDINEIARKYQTD